MLVRAADRRYDTVPRFEITHPLVTVHEAMLRGPLLSIRPYLAASVDTSDSAPRWVTLTTVPPAMLRITTAQVLVSTARAARVLVPLLILVATARQLLATPAIAMPITRPAPITPVTPVSRTASITSAVSTVLIIVSSSACISARRSWHETVNGSEKHKLPPPLCRYVAFLGYLCGMCVALALWVGALYSDDRPSEYKSPGCERWGEGKCGVKRPTCLTRAGFLFVGVLCVARLKRTNEGSRHTRTFVFSEGSRRLSNSVGPFAACRRFRCRPRLWSCVMFHGVRGSLLLF